jgi:hypothetical protein
MKGKHVHHRIAVSNGGTDDPSNLYVCSSWFHTNVWHAEDSYNSLIPYAHEGGEKAYREKKGIHGRTPEQKRLDGIKGAKVLHQRKNEEGKSLHTLKLHLEKDEQGKSLLGVRVMSNLHKTKTRDGKSAYSVNAAKKSHEKKNEEGKSVHAVEMGQKGASQTHAKKNEEGKSINAIRVGLITMSKKNEEGKSVHAVKVGNITYSLGTGCHAPEYKGKGAKVTNSQKWIDPDHPELGERSAPTLASMQKRRGYPHGKENRVRVG